MQEPLDPIQNLLAAPLAQVDVQVPSHPCVASHEPTEDQPCPHAAPVEQGPQAAPQTSDKKPSLALLTLWKASTTSIIEIPNMNNFFVFIS